MPGGVHAEIGAAGFIVADCDEQAAGVRPDEDDGPECHDQQARAAQAEIGLEARAGRFRNRRGRSRNQSNAPPEKTSCVTTIGTTSEITVA